MIEGIATAWVIVAAMIGAGMMVHDSHAPKDMKWPFPAYVILCLFWPVALVILGAAYVVAGIILLIEERIHDDSTDRT